NPLPPKLISEFYMNNGNWAMELSPIGINLSVGDSLRISNQINTVTFPVLEDLSYEQCLVINSTEHPLGIDPNSALISISVYDNTTGNWWDNLDSIMFTSGYPNNCLPGQSLVQYEVSNPEDTSFYLAVEATPTLGTHPYQITSYGTLSGHIDDIGHRPIPNAHIHRPGIFGTTDGITDANGDYVMTGLEGFAQVIEVLINDVNYTTTSVNVIPTQNVVKDFYLTNYVQNQDHTQQYTPPVMISSNPLYAVNSLKFNLGNSPVQGYKLKIFNLKGEIVSELITTQTSGELSMRLPKEMASGVYLYRLDTMNKTCAKGKITIIK
ncbi:MAG TPA: T9SS type A sorting domain-containing protein, partial [Candidatus Cloacimonadota bacterium]|nr:T9SS type A sorting domain-containing protein [Candidatus Cloacimonadota bacterium]